MGYRSEIAFCFTVNQVQKKDERESHYWDYDKAKFKEMVGFFKLSKFYEIATGAEYDLLNKKEPCLGWRDGVIMFYASQWKWYDGYDIVEAYEELWTQMQDIEGISGFFLRVGEEAGDVDEQSFGDDPDFNHFNVYTGMSFNSAEYLGEAVTDEEEQTEQAQTDKTEESSRIGVA